MKKSAMFLLLASLAPGLAAAADPHVDPLKSVMWEFVLQNELKLAPEQVRFDPRVDVYAPASVEDGMNVPVSVRVADELGPVEQIVVLADHNPIQRTLNFYPGRADPYIAFRMKVQEATPIRAVVRTRDGQWFAGGVWLDAPGGGCTTPSVSQAGQLWETDLNRVGAQVWQQADGGDRLRMRIIHPMDTGLVSQIPAFYLEQLVLRDPEGSELARLEAFEPVAENPVFTFSVPEAASNGVGYQLTGNDNNGNAFVARVNIPESGLDLQDLFAD